MRTADADLAPPDLVAQVGIGTRVRMVFKDVAAGLAIPLWTIDEAATQPAAVALSQDALAIPRGIETTGGQRAVDE